MATNYVQKMNFFLSRNKLQKILEDAAGTPWTGLDLNLAIADTGKVYIEVVTYIPEISPSIPGSGTNDNGDDNAAIPTPPGGHTNDYF
jgi:hypothetical protein